MNFLKALVVLLTVCAALVASSCVRTVGPAPVPQGREAYVDVTNDTFDAVDVWVDGLFMTTILSGETHTYDLGFAGTYHVEIFLSGSRVYALNDVNEYFPAGVSTWDIYDNAPVVLVQNAANWTRSECVYTYVDNAAVQFAIGNTWNENVLFDSSICPGETGFYLVDIGYHNVKLDGATSAGRYYDDTRQYVDATHVNFPIPY